jgi:hypothetical protein
MKKKLLYLTSIVLFAASSVNAQIKTWDLGNGGTFWPVTSAANAGATPAKSDFQTETVIDKLGLFPGASGTPSTNILNFGIIAKAADPGFTDLPFANRFQMGGTSSPVSNKPVARYLYFTVDKACTVKVWFKHGSSSGADRTIFVSDGATVYGSAAAAANATNIVTANYTGTGGKIYIYGDASNYLYQIEVNGANVTTPSLGTNTFSKESDVTVYSNNNKVFFSNIKSKTNVAVYSITGALVKSADVNEDSGIEVENGVYIVKLKSAEGEKTVKVIVQ